LIDDITVNPVFRIVNFFTIQIDIDIQSHARCSNRTLLALQLHAKENSGVSLKAGTINFKNG
jgi:hypothetical protein